MKKHREVAKNDLVKKLGFTNEQLDFLGKLLFLSRDKRFIERVEVEYSNSNFAGTKIISIGEEQKIDVSFSLQPSIQNETHEEIERRIKSRLFVNGIPKKDLFSYGEKSYGIEKSKIGIDVYFGFYN